MLVVSLSHTRRVVADSVDLPSTQLNEAFSLFTFSVMVAVPMLFFDGPPTIRSLLPKPTPKVSLRSPPAMRPMRFTVVAS